MRYRPFAASGGSISALTLVLGAEPAKPGEVSDLVDAAIDAGVNAFELQTEDAAVRMALGRALEGIERKLLLVSLRLGAGRRRAGDPAPDYGPDAVEDAVDRVLDQTGLERLDLLSLDSPTREHLTPELTQTFDRLRKAGRVGAFGVAGEGDGMDALIRSRRFQVLTTRFNLLSGWPERNRIRLATDLGLSVIGYGHWGAEMRRTDSPAEAPDRPRSLFFRLARKREEPVKLARDHGYAFLEQTAGWTGEEIGLAYALTEPALASVQITARSPADFVQIARTPEREMPTGLTAHIEMARFAAC